MSIPFLQKLHVGAYLIRQQLTGRKRYPLVLMLEPLFRCNLACAGCGKIDYPDEILNQRISVADALQAVDECGAPVVSIAGGEPLLHKELPDHRQGHHRAAQVRLSVHQRAADGKADEGLRAVPYFVWSVHLDGDKEDHDKSVCQAGIYDRAVAAIKSAKAQGFRCNINCTLFNNADPERMANFFDTVMAMGVDGITVSPGYAYERAPDQQHFLNREKTKTLFRDIFRRGNGGKNWSFSQSGLFLDFLAGNQTYHCTPWGNPTRTVFGWQRPCYLLGEGYAKTFKELMEEHRLGRLRRRQLREVRRLHGALAASRRPRSRTPSSIRSRRWPRPARHRRPRARWRRKFRSIASDRRNSSSHGTSIRSSPKSRRTRRAASKPQPRRFLPVDTLCGPSSGRSTHQGTWARPGQPGLRITCLSDYEFTHV